MKKTLLIGALFASSALFAQCDISNAQNAWENVREDVATQMDVTAPGTGGSACKLTVNSTSSNADRARVRDRSPSCESSFRASFVMNADAVGSLANNQRNKVYNFQCNEALNGGAVTCANVGIGQFRLQGDDGSNILRSFVTDEGQVNPDNRRKFDIPVGAGDQTFEIQWVRASGNGVADGVFRMWHSGNTTEASPNLEYTDLENFNYCVDQVNLGLIKATNGWVGNKAGLDLIFDEYESRRQTGITVN